MMTNKLTIFFVLVAFRVFATDMIDAATLEKLSDELQHNGVEGLMKVVKDKGVSAPRIPSKWFIEECIHDKDEKDRAKATRDFGQKVGIQLEQLAKEQQALPAGEPLYNRTLLLCEAGEWCGETVGYGNIFLARRFLDLAAVGLARLTVSTNFPLASCEFLASRMTPSWLGMAYRLQILNQEVGTNLFLNAKMTNQELEWQWSIGWSMWAMSNKKTTSHSIEAPNPVFVNVNAITNKLFFFSFNETAASPVTMLKSWDLRQHRFIATGLDLQSVEKAVELLRFRSIIGYFPEKFKRSTEEQQQLEKDIIEAAKWGAKITPMEKSPSFDPLKEAFRRAWLNRSNRKVSEDNRYTLALQAYREVLGGVFFDRDTAEIENVKQQQEMDKARKKKDS